VALRNQNVFGYGVAIVGTAIIGAALVFLGIKITDSVTLISILVGLGALMIAMGMYVVIPKETHEALDAVGDAAERLPIPRFARGERARSGPQPMVVTPADHQSTIVAPPAAPPVVVTPAGKTKPVERAEDIDLITSQPVAPPPAPVPEEVFGFADFAGAPIEDLQPPAVEEPPVAELPAKGRRRRGIGRPMPYDFPPEES
jgi:hypothetical protein